MTATRRKTIKEKPSLEAQERLIEIMNDSTRKLNFAGTEWEIRALRPGTQWLIAQEAVSIAKAETSEFSDVVKQFAVNVPSVVKVITLALLNDRERIYANGRSGAFSEEYNSTYDTIMWDTNQSEWLNILVDVLQMLDIEVFFSTTSLITISRQRLLERKMTAEEQRQSLLGQNGAR